MSSIQSRYVRIQPYSGFCSLVRSRRSSSRSTSVRTPSGIPAFATRSRYVETTSLPPSFSCFLIASSCCRSRNSRWVFSMPSATSLRIFSFSEASASICFVQPISLVRRSSTSRVSSTSSFCSVVRAGDGADAAVMAVDPRHEEDQAVALSGGLDGGLGRIALDGEGDGHVRQDDHIVHRHDGKQFGLGHLGVSLTHNY